MDLIFSIIHKDRTVYADNTVRVNGLVLQIEKSPYRISFARCKVDIYEHLDGTYSVVWKKRVLGRYNAEGKLIYQNKRPNPQSSRGVSSYKIPDRQDKEGQSKMPFPCPIDNQQTGHFTCYENRTS
jgi:hypothetical protein